VACAVALELRRRLELVARAEHELRGPATALLLAWERLLREPAARGRERALGVQLLRLQAGLLDLTAARSGRRRPARLERVRLLSTGRDRPSAGGAPSGAGRRVGEEPAAPDLTVLVDRGRAAQALGNLLSNAAEHGRGETSVRTRVIAGGVEIEVRNRAADQPAAQRGRRRGLRIARAAADASGGELRAARDGDEFAAVLRLPLTDGDDPPPAA
jgi:signal transduction histidine kinase